MVECLTNKTHANVLAESLDWKCVSTCPVSPTFCGPPREYDQVEVGFNRSGRSVTAARAGCVLALVHVVPRHGRVSSRPRRIVAKELGTISSGPRSRRLIGGGGSTRPFSSTRGRVALSPSRSAASRSGHRSSHPQSAKSQQSHRTDPTARNTNARSPPALTSFRPPSVPWLLLRALATFLFFLREPASGMAWSPTLRTVEIHDGSLAVPPFLPPFSPLS